MSDSRRFSRSLAAAGLFIGPILFFLATLADPAWGDDPAAYLEAVAGAPGRYLLAGALWSIGSLLLIPGMLGVMKLMRGKGVTLGQVGAGLFAMGSILFSSSMVLFGVDIVVAQSADRPAAVALSEALEGNAVINGFFMFTFLGGIVLGSILLAVALFRHRIVPLWSPALLVASTVLGFIGETQMLSSLSLLLLAVGFVPLGQKIWSLSDEAWGLWEPLSSELGETRTTSSSPPDPHPA